MLFELALMSVAIVAAYWGAIYVRRRPYGTATFGWMLLATAGLALASLAARHAGGGLDVLGAIALGAGGCLLIVGPLLRAASRWAVNAEHLTLASWLIDLRDLLQPGTGGREEKILVGALTEVRAGRVDDAVAALRGVRGRATPAGRRQIDERIAFLYLSAFRFRDAIDHVERTLADDPAYRRADATVADAMGALTVSPALGAELIGAYGRVGQLAHAAALADRLDRLAATSPELVFLVHRVRLVLLAFAGRIDAVERLLSPPRSAHMTPAARLYWSGVACERAGDRVGARRAYQDALDRARREPRARAVVSRALDDLDGTAAAELTPEIAAVVDRLAASELTMPPRARRRRHPVTIALIAINLAVAAAIAVFLGGPGDLGAIVRAGAMVRTAIDVGEIWRLPASTFIHVGLLHLAVNVIGLWVLGRIAESVLGRVRTVAVYLAAALGGAAASHWCSDAGVAAGASGAIFGLVGALLAELVLHRRRYRPAWRRGLVSALSFATVAELALGLAFPIVDDWAHFGGLVTGAAVAAAISPHVPWRRLGFSLAVALAGVGGAISIAAGVAAVSTDFGDTLRRYPRTIHRIATVEVTAPATWVHEPDKVLQTDVLVDPDLTITLAVARRGSIFDTHWTRWVGDAGLIARESGLARIAPAASRQLALPPGWTSAEYVATARDELGTLQHFRLIAAGRLDGADSLLATLLVPDELVPGAARELTEILTSLRPQAPRNPTPDGAAPAEDAPPPAVEAPAPGGVEAPAPEPMGALPAPAAP